MAVIWNTSSKKVSFELEISNQCFLIVISFQDRQYFFVFLVSVINHYHINVFFIKGFRTIVFFFYCYFHNVLADMSSGLPQVFVELWNLHGTLNYVFYWIHVGHLFRFC